jgi:hypothetical protein
MDHERDYATLDKSVRSPIGPVVPGTYMSTSEGSALVPELTAERDDTSCHIFVALPHLLPLTGDTIEIYLPGVYRTHRVGKESGFIT